MSWCGMCSMIAPILEEIAQERGGIKVGKINVDEQPELAGIMSIPALVVIQNGKVVNRPMGVRLKSQMLSLL